MADMTNTSTPTRPLKILFVAASPAAAGGVVHFDRELGEIQNRLMSAGLTTAFEFIFVPAAQPLDIQQGLRNHLPDIVHFSGHGTAHGELVLDDSSGALCTDKTPLRELFKLVGQTVRLVVLNACHSATIAKEIAEEIGCALGTKQAIDDHAAIEFAATFYEAIARGDSVAKAFALGKNLLSLKNFDPNDAAFVHTRTDVDANSLVLVRNQQSIRPQIAEATRILLHLDLASDNPIPEEELAAQLGDGIITHTLKATQFGAVAAPAGRVTDIRGAADAIHRMMEVARSKVPNGSTVRYFVVGRAILPLFVQLGMALSSWASVTALNRRKQPIWDILPIDQVPDSKAPKFFEAQRGLSELSDASGRVAISVSTGGPIPREKIHALMNDRGESVANIVELVTNKVLDATNAAQAMHELCEMLNQKVREVYPKSKGIALFVNGPATLALMIGRAINPNVVGDVWVANYNGSDYQFAISLPFKPHRRPMVSSSASDERDRYKTLTDIRDGIVELQKKLNGKHLPPALKDDEKKRFLSRLEAIEIAREPAGEGFSIDVAERTMAIGNGLLEALRKIPEALTRTRIGQALLIHEIFHYDQNFPSPIHGGIGGAGFALEEVDFWADAVAVGTLAIMDMLKFSDEEANRQAAKIATEHVEAVLEGLEAFDRFEHGDKIELLAERRLRRYLIWHLQWSRAATLRRVEDLWSMLDRRIVVELAPLRGHLDERYDKLVDDVTRETGIFVVLQGRLLRIPGQDNFNPATIVEAIRTFKREPVRQAMRFVREHDRAALTPWVH